VQISFQKAQDRSTAINLYDKAYKGFNRKDLGEKTLFF
jgi:hypothetical protein